MRPLPKSILRRLLGRRIAMIRSWRIRNGERSWSQEGEDRILWRYFNYRREGFYVDVGAHHPFRFSNTNLLHLAGWQGINIDAMPNSMQEFARHRPRDVNLEIGVSEQPGSMMFHVFNESALNTFDPKVAAAHTVPPWRIVSTVNVELRPLADILRAHAKGKTIDLLTVDAEGHDLSVLRSNDWEMFRPRVVLAESLGQSIAELADDPCAKFMLRQGYSAFAKTVNTVIYTDDKHQ